MVREGQLTKAEGGNSARLPPVLADAFAERARRVRAPRGSVVIGEGTRSDEVFLILSGRLQASVLSFGGWETVFRSMGAGELVGELAAIDGGDRSASVTVLDDAELAVLSAVAFRKYLTEVPGAGYWLARQLALRVRELSDRAFEMASLPVGGRLIAELLRLPGESDGDGRTIDGLPTHAELAARIGTHRETITRELRGLTQRGLIAQSGRSLRILSLAALDDLLQELRR